MGYLVCQNCGGYYKLKEGESAEDFVACQCYGQLVHVESLEDIKENEEVKDKSVFKFNDYSDHNVNDESDYIVVNGDSETESPNENVIDQDIDVKKDSEHTVGEPTVKNRAYYRRYDYYSKPDIIYLKNLKDVPGLINALFYDDLNIKLEAAQALAVVGDDRAIEPLNKIINQEGGSLKLYAEIAVKQIRSRKYGYKSLSREDYRKSSTKPTESPEPHHTIPDTPQKEVLKEEISEDDFHQTEISEDEFSPGGVTEDGSTLERLSEDVSTPEGVSEDKSIKEMGSEAKIKPDTRKPVSQDISRIHDEQDLSQFADVKDTKLTDGEPDINPIDHENDLSSSEDKIISEEIKKRPSAVKKSNNKLVDDESHDENLSPIDSIDFEVTETEKLKNLKASNHEIPDDQKVEINIKLSEEMSQESKTSIKTKLISESNLSSETKLLSENNLSSETKVISESNQSSDSKKSFETKKLSEKISRKIPGKTPSVTLKTVDDTLLSSDPFNNQPLPDSNKPGMIRNITGVFKNSATTVPTPVVDDKIVPPKPSPVLTNTTITHKKTDSFTKKEENTDKQIIGFIILFSIILIVGVILTMTQMKI